MNRKNIVLIVVLVLIVVSIIILQNNSYTPSDQVNVKTIKTNSSAANEKSLKYPYAIELGKSDGFINTDNISISDYVGKKVILVDFWTYSCINCQRTLPYLTSWYDKYKDQGLIIIGVHTPEFEFEKNYDNVKKAVEKYEIKYPVVLDNGYETWSAYKNHYWPRKYLIDIDGFIVYDHIGEGGYAETEKKIQELLEERKTRLGLDTKIDQDIVQPNVSDTEFNMIQTPEIYFGYDFSRNQMGNAEGYKANEIVNYKLPLSYLPNKFYMKGNWLNNPDNLESSEDGEIVLSYSAKNVNLVAGADKSVKISVYIDDKFVQNLTVSDYDLYKVYSAKEYGKHTIKIKTASGLRAYTFTFG